MTCVAVALAIAAGCDAGDEADETVGVSDEIINGTTVTANDKGAVAIYVGGNFRCSGTYMGGKWVITARHCLEQTKDIPNPLIPPQGFWVTALRNPGPTIPTWVPAGASSTVTVTRVYANFVDVGMLKLTNALSATYVTPPSGGLGPPRAVGQTNQQCQGYGNFTNTGTGSGTLRKATLTINGVGVHSPNETNPRTDWPYQIRYGRNSSGQIQFFGDSGGPCFTPIGTPGGTVWALTTVHRTGYPSTNGVTPDNSFGVAVTTDTPWFNWIGTNLSTP
jgi:hypothetical protein